MLDYIRSEILRLKNATKFSKQGFMQAWHGEAAFRFEAVLAALLIPVAIFLPVIAIERVALITSVLLVLIVELLNSAVEAVVDRVGTEEHPLSGMAKDMGSAAVLVSLCIVIFTWGAILARFIV
ncbi:MAG: diacylglycerol kinase [Cellvibrionaceae bacterium]